LLRNKLAVEAASSSSTIIYGSRVYGGMHCNSGSYLAKKITTRIWMFIYLAIFFQPSMYLSIKESRGLSKDKALFFKNNSYLIMYNKKTGFLL